MDPLKPMDFDALQYTQQGFNTLDNLASSQAVQNMTDQTLKSIRAMQTPTVQGYTPGHVTLPIFQQQQATAQFFVIADNEQKGPYSLTEIHGMLSAGLISHQTLAWATGMKEWATVQACLQNVQH